MHKCLRTLRLPSAACTLCLATTPVKCAVAEQVHGFLSNPTSQAQSYWYLGTAALTTALLCLTVPGHVARFMLSGTPDAVVETLVRAAGATLVTSAAVKYTLKVRASWAQVGQY